MKNFIIFLIISCLPQTKALAQIHLAGIGPSGGGSASSFNYGAQVDTVQNFNGETKLGGTGGLRFDFDFGPDNETLKLSPEVFIVQNGSKEYYTNFSAIQNDLVSRRVNLNYIGLYIPFTVYLPIGNFPNAFNGLLLSVKGYGDYTVGSTIKEEATGLDSKINFKRQDDKFDGGLGADLSFVQHGFTFRIGYNYGLKNVRFTNAIGSTATGQENFLINNRGFTVSFGFLAKVD